MKTSSYDVIVGMDWLKSINPAIDSMACSLAVTVGTNQHTVFTLLMNSVANVTIPSVKQVLAEVKCGCPAWFGLLYPNSLPDFKGVLAALGEGDNTKILGTDPLQWEQICSDFGDTFEQPSTLPERTIKHEIGLLPDSVQLTNR